ncbi:hypothetical protein PM082_015150 [Marasmius tenuissimus]|nr:hypothetical protein PM082_015150 [Marasmius tenuissimus]
MSATQNTNTGSGTQTNYNTISSFINLGENQVVARDVVNVGRIFVRNFTTTRDVRDPHSRVVARRMNVVEHDNLWNAVVGVGASHTAEQQFGQGCLPGTREGAIGTICDWLKLGKGEPICWLAGAVGVGKSAIAMTVAENLDTRNDLISSFFFIRSDPRRNNPSALVLTISHGLVVKTPSRRASINKIISSDPTILEAQLERQFRELVVQPLVQTKPLWKRMAGSLAARVPTARKDPKLVIIDGLDECSDEMTQLRIIDTISSAFREHPHIPLRFLICSRPESWIREAFTARPLRELSKIVFLDASFHPDEDIMRFYRHHFQEIATSARYGQVEFPSPWPSADDLEALVQRTCGQFVYAMTVIKFIMLAYSHPVNQLRIILQSTPSRRQGVSPYRELDALYDVILGCNPDYEKVLPILAAILVLQPHLPPSPACIELLFGLPKGEVTLTLRAMYSVLDINGLSDEIRVYHNSFREYLLDRDRSRNFHIDLSAQKHLVAQQWLQNVSTSRVPTYSLDQLYLKSTTGVFTQWSHFCTSLPKPTSALLAGLRNANISSVLLCRQLARRQAQPWPGLTFASMAMRRSCPDWDQIFRDLVLWIGRYEPEGRVKPGQSPYDENYRHTRAKFRERPKHFHLERSPDMPAQGDTITVHQRQVVLYAAGCKWWTRLTSQVDSEPTLSPPVFRLKDCHCDLPKGRESDYPDHLAYQEACKDLVDAFISDFEAIALASSTPDDGMKIDLHGSFGNLVDSSLLQHCRLEPELLVRCRFLFELAKGCSFLETTSDWRRQQRTRLFKWIKTFPNDFIQEARVLEAQVNDVFPV